MLWKCDVLAMVIESIEAFKILMHRAFGCNVLLMKVSEQAGAHFYF
ncbi:hypothetical protein SAMN02745751_01168 [Dethiosulfatibacter aminovorans DSM 17477]|uniref:Uncharacterized protein n=1 Tax=Dethiosulfatibacter aminovorans DSM 17477 TaxID=1121476 RepID=A0A1M6EE05_9FIRM|nr:hypothetical protein SAMN02745751_01168 [Dethiosulfatibacter aminovorans DSM 17477]